MQLNRETLKATRWLKSELADCKSVLDLGCGQSSLLQYVRHLDYSLGVEYWQPYIDESRYRQIHTDYMQADINDVWFDPGTFDAVMLVDVLEHIDVMNANRLFLKMSTWAKKKVIIIVPNGDMPQEDPYGDGNEKQRHISQWSPETLKNRGYEVRGFGGWKPLRGDGAEIVPTRTLVGHYALSALSGLSDPVVRYIPEHAFHLFGVLRK
jgi:SAM-dependent methyltransferase